MTNSVTISTPNPHQNYTHLKTQILETLTIVGSITVPYLFLFLIFN